MRVTGDERVDPGGSGERDQVVVAEILPERLRRRIGVFGHS